MRVRRAFRVAMTTTLLSMVLLATTDSKMQQVLVETIRYDVSGVTVVHRMTPGNHVVSVRLYLLGGTSLVTGATAGVEPLYLRARELGAGRSFARTGSEPILEATHDWTVSGFVGLRTRLRDSWAAWAHRFQSTTLDDNYFDQARGELAANAHDRYSDPDRRVHWLAWRNVFANHHYQFDPWGTQTSLAQLGREDVEGFMVRHLVRSRLLLVVVGDVSRDEVAGLVSETFDGFPQGDFAWSLPEALKRRGDSWLTEHRLLPTNYILAYYVGPQPNDREYFAFQVATSLMSNRMYQTVRAEQGLSYAAGARFMDGALPVGGLYASSVEPATVYYIMIDELTKLQQFDARGPAWSRFKDQYLLDYLGRSMTTDAQVDAIARAHLLFDDVEMADDYVDRLKGVNARQVRIVAERFMRHLQLAFLGDTSSMRGRW